MDIKTWFENGTGMKIKELRYLKMPPLPYNIFIDDTVYRGADLKNNIIEHNVVFEHYSETINEDNERVKSTAAFDKQYLEGRYGADPYLQNMLSGGDWL